MKKKIGRKYRFETVDNKKNLNNFRIYDLNQCSSIHFSVFVETADF
jgi:hypothetical protein